MPDVKLCKDCKHLRDRVFCDHENNTTFDYVTGESRSIQTPQFLRYEGKCGKEARWFEPKAPA